MRYLERFLAWGTTDLALPYLAALGVAVAGFALMWVKAHWATIPHELGHAFVALALGKRLSGIDIRRDTSGETRTYEARPRSLVLDLLYLPFRWIRNLLVSLAGYPAPFALAYALAWFLGDDRAKIGLVLLAVLLGFTLLHIRNGFGFMIVALGLTIIGGALYLGSSLVAEVMITALVGGMLAGGIKGLGEAWKVYNQDRLTSAERWKDPLFEPQHSDARALARRTFIPQLVWLVTFTLIGIVLFFLTAAEFISAY